MVGSDVHINPISNALDQVNIDFVSCGSVGSIQSFFLIRFLRRLGACVSVTLSPQGDMFVTKSAFSWAGAKSVNQDFDPSSSNHICSFDHNLCVVSAASASFIAKLATGITDSAASCLVQSYFGDNKKTVIIIPSMHDSLFNSVFVQNNINALKQHKHVVFLQPISEDGKKKFPEPVIAAAHIAHHYNSKILANNLADLNNDNNVAKKHSIVIAMGATRSYIDDVRFIRGYSSGQMGSGIAESFYMKGFKTHIVLADCHIKPRWYSSCHECYTVDELEKSVIKVCQMYPDNFVLCASVSDYVVEEKKLTKVRSDLPGFSIKLVPTEKIRSQHKKFIFKSKKNHHHNKVCFKLEPSILKNDEMIRLFDQFYQNDSVTHLIFNSFDDIKKKYQAFAVKKVELNNSKSNNSNNNFNNIKDLHKPSKKKAKPFFDLQHKIIKKSDVTYQITQIPSKLAVAEYLVNDFIA